MHRPSPTVAVRTLCEFTAREGDLDLRFTPSPTAQQGIAGHQLVASRRGAGYEREIALEGSFDGLTVRGRADGFDPALVQLEEIKTHRGDLARQPANHRALHWAQLKVYGWLMCEARGLASLRLALVYHDLGSQQETVIVEEPNIFVASSTNGGSSTARLLIATFSTPMPSKRSIASSIATLRRWPWSKRDSL